MVGVPLFVREGGIMLLFYSIANRQVRFALQLLLREDGVC
jgi:hypothetical protein